ncbi:invasion associated locus B family protein (plasmid) [Methylobacterium currus]|uniref:invasion associated locus B family protein n=1 Tax=Methylobacterium currus TaxID=2051553 RepID=UPI001E4FF0B5|nr:invasion associated locus B family protein [Methylobacterium currus]UHC20201.1 invasion associated locus B family protein [Methylobacterium currus]
MTTIPGRILALAAILLAGSAAAQTPPKPGAAPSPTPSEPGLTTASYGDWVLRCQRFEGDKPARLCEVSQAMQIQGQNAPIAQVAIGRPADETGLRVTVLLPVSVSFPSSVRVSGTDKDGKEAGVLDLTWRRCQPGGCLADGPAKDDALKRWRDGVEAGRLAFKDAAGRDLGIPVSFRGLGQALDALARER